MPLGCEARVLPLGLLAILNHAFASQWLECMLQGFQSRGSLRPKAQSAVTPRGVDGEATLGRGKAYNGFDVGTTAQLSPHAPTCGGVCQCLASLDPTVRAWGRLRVNESVFVRARASPSHVNKAWETAKTLAPPMLTPMLPFVFLDASHQDFLPLSSCTGCLYFRPKHVLSSCKRPRLDPLMHPNDLAQLAHLWRGSSRTPYSASGYATT
ncbi:hypothetical protein VNO77_19424 [Canavalia gladiata]|uniref:Uncharacterized protein n=1 Tax=Canavalia gladiata TaxID=3824 RepID=A0AAN9QKH2_CANGL